MHFIFYFLLSSSLLIAASTAISLQELNKLSPSSDSSFGYSAAISGDTVIMGTYGYNNKSGTSFGLIYIYVKNNTTGLFEYIAKLKASDDGTYDFGRRVAISGNTIVVGAYLSDDSGSIYLYEKPSGGWIDSNQESAKLKASDGADFFGESLIINGNTVVVGTTSWKDCDWVYLYEKPNGGWIDSNQESFILKTSNGANNNLVGKSVAISNDTVVIGMNGKDLGVPSDSTYIFIEETVATPLKPLFNPTVSTIDSDYYWDIVTIDGSDFGDETNATVTVNGDICRVKSWTNTKIVVEECPIRGCDTLVAISSQGSFTRLLDCD